MFKSIFGPMLGMLVLMLVFCGLAFYAGQSRGEKKVQVRYDSLSRVAADCKEVVNTVKIQAKVASEFLTDYDNRISKLEDEKRVLQNAYSDTVAVLRRYNDREAERAVAAYYYRRQQ